MKTSSIRVEGNIISPELFDKLDSKDILGQNPSDFGFERSFKVKDDIARAWADAKDQWNIFKRRTENLTESQSGIEETRKFWIIPLLENLGYKLEFQRSSEIVNEKSYAISHRVEALDNFPVHIMGVNYNLDKRRETGGPRMSPHALLQEYLNVTEHLYGIVTNGYFLRILRDSGKLVRLSYLEFNLQRMLEDDLYAEFSIMYRLIHSSRMPKKQTEAEQSIFEQYHQDAIESGSRIREKLSAAVEKSIKIIANGFLAHPANEQLRNAIINCHSRKTLGDSDCHSRESGNLPLQSSESLSPEEFFKQLLRFIYRILFLLVIEERDIVYPDVNHLSNVIPVPTKVKNSPSNVILAKAGIHTFEESAYLKKIYYNNYSISRLRKLADKIYFFDDKLDDLWISLKNTFNIFIEERYAKKLGIYPLGGDLFSPGAIGLLSQSQLDNKVLLECIHNLSLFESPNGKDVIRVNYAALNVEEFGSVYEGLLEYDGKFNIQNQQITFEFIESSGRASSGSHYTPEELVQPLIKHSLDYIIEDKLAAAKMSFTTGSKNPPSFPRKRESNDSEPLVNVIEAQSNALLSIKVCDVACGSGHILLSAARRIAIELARVRTGEDQPSPEPYRHALRDVINHCIYGVDKNPLAVELCKVALWLEAYNPGLPLSFLDHKIKCGDSIVGLARREDLEKGIANEAFKKMPGDDPEVIKFLAKKNKDEIAGQLENLFDRNAVDENVKHIYSQFKQFDELPEFTLEEVKKKAEQYDVMKGADWWRLKEAADIQVSQFFIPKTKQNQNMLTTFSEYYNILNGNKAGFELKTANAMAIAAEKKFFHWFLEFPEVMQEGGFDCILGNPPFLGGLKISSHYGYNFLEWLKYNYHPAGGTSDLVGYFFRRVFVLLKEKGFLSLISTNTISQGDTREGSLAEIQRRGGEIIYALKSMKWPGIAILEISQVAIVKGKWNGKRFLNKSISEYISSYLDDNQLIRKPNKLIVNKDLSFIGSYLFGDGFLLSENDVLKMISNNSNNKQVLFPYISGEDLYSRFDQSPSRWTINFFDWNIEEAKLFVEPFEEVEKKVFPFRKSVKETNNTAKRRRKFWWQYGAGSVNLYKEIEGLDRVLAVAQTSKTLAFTFLPHGYVYSLMTVIFPFTKYFQFSILQSMAHYIWAWTFGSTMKTDLRYTPSDIFETFPFPQNSSKETELELEKIGQEYYEYRSKLMQDMKLGLTKTYNLFHTPQLTTDNKQLTKANLKIPIEQAIKDLGTLRQLHKQMDEAVLKAYGWSADVIANGAKQSQPPIDLRHDFYEVDYLPENDRIRYTIHPEARKEILKRLLELNHKIHAEEVALGLLDKKRKKKNKTLTVDKNQGGLF